jgi:hypothetical protein
MAQAKMLYTKNVINWEPTELIVQEAINFFSTYYENRRDFSDPSNLLKRNQLNQARSITELEKQSNFHLNLYVVRDSILSHWQYANRPENTPTGRFPIDLEDSDAYKKTRTELKISFRRRYWRFRTSLMKVPELPTNVKRGLANIALTALLLDQYAYPKYTGPEPPTLLYLAGAAHLCFSSQIKRH